jgi:thioredoxin-like negative regulator of GroEL
MKMLASLMSVLWLLFASNAFAANMLPYTQDAFDSLIKTGKPVVVAVHADWCPTCRAQQPILLNLLKQNKYRAITALRVDYDGQKEVVKAFRVFKQSTLIVFKGGKEVGRTIGDTSQDRIAHLLDKAL